MNPTEATNPKRKRLWRTCLNAVMGLVSLFVCWALIGVSFNFSGQSPLQSLETARDRWDATGIDDYKISLGYGSYSFIGGLHLTIHDDQIVEVAEYMGLDQMRLPTPVSQAETAEYVQIFAQYGNFPAELNDYTIDGLFDFAAEKLSSQPTMPLVSWCNSFYNEMSAVRYETTINEEYGYLQSLQHTNCTRWDFGGGLLCGVRSHCASGIRIAEFEPLP